MYIFKDYNNLTIAKFQKRGDFIMHLNKLCGIENSAFNEDKYFNKFSKSCDFKSAEGYVFDGFSLGWCVEQDRYRLLGYWTKTPCNDENY